MYDPRVGRWLEEDPLGFDAGDENLYRYVENAPIALTDALGLYSYRVGIVEPETPTENYFDYAYVAVYRPDRGDDPLGAFPQGTYAVNSMEQMDFSLVLSSDGSVQTFGPYRSHQVVLTDIGFPSYTNLGTYKKSIYGARVKGETLHFSLREQWVDSSPGQLPIDQPLVLERYKRSKLWGLCSSI